MQKKKARKNKHTREFTIRNKSTTMTQVHIGCQPLLGVNVQSLGTCISLMQAGVFHFLAGSRGILNSKRHMWQRKEEALCEIHMRNFKPHFRQDFLAYCTRPVSVHLVMACVSCSGFSTFLLSLKQQNLMKNYVIHFPAWPYGDMAILENG